MSTSEPQPYHHGGLPAALIAAALGLLREGGTEALSLRAAARRAGVSAMAPYRHFADKEALLAAVAAEGFARLAERLAAADADADPKQALIGQGVAYVRFACDEPALFKLMFGAAEPTGHPALRAQADGAYAVLDRRVASFARPEDREDTALAAWSLVHGLASLIVDGQLRDHEASADAVAGRVTRLLVRSL